MQKADKERLVAELSDRLKNTQTLIVADYRGLTVTDIDKLRASCSSTAPASRSSRTRSPAARPRRPGRTRCSHCWKDRRQSRSWRRTAIPSPSPRR